MRFKGYSLPELLFTLMLITLLFQLGLSTYRSLSLSYQYNRNTTQWFSFLNSAREHAFQNNQPVSVCPFNVNTQRCSLKRTQTWASFTDTNNNNEREPSETLIQILELKKNTRYRLYIGHNRYSIRFQRPRYNKIFTSYPASLTVCPNGKPDPSAIHIRVNILGRIGFDHRRNEQGIVARSINNQLQDIEC